MLSFLAPLINSTGGRAALRNTRTGAIVSDQLIPALDSASRRTGLLKHNGLAPGEAMVIAPTSAIHTFFMRFPIDVVFVNRTGDVVKICKAVNPWRIAWAWRAHAVVEAAAGTIASGPVAVGDRLVVTIPREQAAGD
jgi:uncharacterized membrane protein (UPF0127 family)